jgi:hypothetical protein
MCEYDNSCIADYLLDSNPNMAYAPVDIAKHRGHPLKSFSIPAPPSNTPMIPGYKQGNTKLNCPKLLIDFGFCF